MGVALVVGTLGVWMAPFQIGALIDGLSFSSAQSGLIGTVEIAAMSITAVLVTALLARWTSAQIAIFGALLACIFQLSSALITDSVVLMFARLITGVGCGLIFGSMCAAAAASKNPDRDFAFAQAVMNVIYIVLFAITPYVLIAGQYRGLFLGYALLMVVAIPFIRLIDLRSDPTQGEEHIPAVSKRKMGLVIVGFCATAIFSTGAGALWGFVERMGAENVGLSVNDIGLLLSASVVFMLGGSLAAGILGVRWGRTAPLVLASVLSGVGVLIASVANTYWWYAIGLMLYSFWYLFITPYIIAGTSSTLDSTGKLASAMGGTMFLFYSVGVGVGGFIVEYLSLAAIGWFGLLTSSLAAGLFAITSQKAGQRIVAL